MVTINTLLNGLRSEGEDLQELAHRLEFIFSEKSELVMNLRVTGEWIVHRVSLIEKTLLERDKALLSEVVKDFGRTLVNQCESSPSGDSSPMIPE